MALNTDTTFEKKLTCAFKNDMRDYSKFSLEHFESLKIRTFMGSFYSKQKLHELKIYKGVLCHDNEELYQI